MYQLSKDSVLADDSFLSAINDSVYNRQVKLSVVSKLPTEFNSVRKSSISHIGTNQSKYSSGIRFSFPTAG